MFSYCEAIARPNKHCMDYVNIILITKDPSHQNYEFSLIVSGNKMESCK